MNHHANAKFWAAYAALHPEVQALADKNVSLMKADQNHPTVNFKRVNRYWSARIGLSHRALAVRDGDDVIWFWIGEHGEYNRLIR